MNWQENKNGLQRTIVFSNQTALATFVLNLAEISDAQNHHADMQIVYNRLQLTLITHDAGAVTQKDWDFSESIDLLLKKFRQD